MDHDLKNQINIWRESFKETGEIPIPDDEDNLDWIEDNHIFLIDWIINSYIPENALIQLRKLKSILSLLEINGRYLIDKNIEEITKIVEKQNELLVYAKNYRQVNKQEIKEKRAKYYIDRKDDILCKKILFNLNSGITVKPRQKTLEKYNIKYNGERWNIE